MPDPGVATEGVSEGVAGFHDAAHEIDGVALAEMRAGPVNLGIRQEDLLVFDESNPRSLAAQLVALEEIVGHLTRKYGITPEQIKTHIEDLAASYERPADVVRWYQSDNRRMAEVEAIVVENNVTEFVLAKAQVTDKAVAFDELMQQS